MQLVRPRRLWQLLVPGCTSCLLLCLVVLCLTALPSPVACNVSFTLVTAAGPFQPRREGAFELLPYSVTYTDPDSGITYTAGSVSRPLYVLHGFEHRIGRDRNGNLTSYVRNDVWLSSDSGARWTLVAGWNSARAEERKGAADGHTFTSFTNGSRAASLIDKRSRLFRIGGESTEQLDILDNNRDVTSEVWMSTNAKDWTRQSVGRFQPARAVASAISDSASVLYLLGGEGRDHSGLSNPVYFLNDVWRSSNQGRDWTLQTAAAQFSARGWAVLLHNKNSKLLQGKEVLTLLGGYGPQGVRAADRPHNDVWASSDQGRSWARVTSAAPWSARDTFNAEVTKAGLIVLTGGWALEGGNTNDVWVSADGGYTWSRCVEDAEWSDRTDLLTMLDERETLIVGGGVGPSVHNDVWRSSISFGSLASVVSACAMNRPTCTSALGLGMACWPGGSTFVSTDGRSVTCPAVQTCNLPPADDSSTADGSPPQVQSGADRTTVQALVAALVAVSVLLLITAAYAWRAHSARSSLSSSTLTSGLLSTAGSEKDSGMTATTHDGL